MRKKTKIILIVISSIVLLIGVLSFLIFKTNLFLDTSDLVCSFTYAGGEDQKIYVIKFNNRAIITEYEEKDISFFENEEEAKKNYNDLLEYYNSNNIVKEYYDNNIKLIDNMVESSFYFKVKENDNKYGKTKKEIKNMFEVEYLYKCE